MKDSISKSIAEIMAFFDFKKVAEIEEKFFNESCNEDDELEDVIKEFALENLFQYAKDCENMNVNHDGFIECKFHLRFEYKHDGSYMELKYIPVSWEKY